MSKSLWLSDEIKPVPVCKAGLPRLFWEKILTLFQIYLHYSCFPWFLAGLWEKLLVNCCFWWKTSAQTNKDLILQIRGFFTLKEKCSVAMATEWNDHTCSFFSLSVDSCSSCVRPLFVDDGNFAELIADNFAPVIKALVFVSLLWFNSITRVSHDCECSRERRESSHISGTTFSQSTLVY